MHKPLVAVSIVLLLLVSHTTRPLAQPAESNESRRLRDAALVVDEVMAARDRSIPQSILEKAEGIAVFPNTVKAGFIVGGIRGRGVLSAHRDGRWSAPT